MDMPSFPPWVWCFPTLPHMSPHPWHRCEKVLVYVPVDNTHPLLDIHVGAAQYKSVGCTRGNTVTKMRRI